MNPYELEHLAAQRQADLLKEAAEARMSGGHARRLAVAGVLRRLADRLDGGGGERKRVGTAARALDSSDSGSTCRRPLSQLGG
jgi:hypothetical protein